MLVTKASQRPMGSKVKNVKGLQTGGRTNDDQKSSLFLRFRLADKKKKPYHFLCPRIKMILDKESPDSVTHVIVHIAYTVPPPRPLRV